MESPTVNRDRILLSNQSRLSRLSIHTDLVRVLDLNQVPLLHQTSVHNKTERNKYSTETSTIYDSVWYRLCISIQKPKKLIYYENNS